MKKLIDDELWSVIEPLLPPHPPRRGTNPGVAILIVPSILNADDSFSVSSLRGWPSQSKPNPNYSSRSSLPRSCLSTQHPEQAVGVASV